MSDIIDRLKKAEAYLLKHTPPDLQPDEDDKPPHTLFGEAADEIERLRAQCEGLAQSALNNGQELLLFERENERLRDLLAFNGINPDAQVESAKGASKFYGRSHDDQISKGRQSGIRKGRGA